MIEIHPQMIKDKKGKDTFVIIPIKEYLDILEELEDIEDVRLYDEAKKNELEFIDADIAFQEIEKNRL